MERITTVTDACAWAITPERVLAVVPIITFFVLRLHAQVISTIAGMGAFGTPGCGAFSGDGGPALAAELSEPFSLLFDADGDLIFTDGVNNRIRLIDPGGTITTIAGVAERGYNGDDIPATTAKLAPFGITMDPAGNLHLADGGNNRIRRIGTNGIITTIAGTGEQGFSGDGGPATQAKLYRPSNLAFDATGNLYFADWYNNRIRRIDTQGIITTVAGSGAVGEGVGGYGGDGGPATEARLFNPIGLAFGPEGDLYISDFRNNRIRRVDDQGIITTVAGTGAQGYNGDHIPATAAKLNRPSGLAFDADGNLIFSDEVNLRIRMIDPGGMITTIAGNGIQGYTGDNGPPTLAEVNDAVGITFDGTGDLFFCDELNNRLRKITDYALVAGIEPITQDGPVRIYPNPSAGTFAIEAETMTTASISIRDVHGALVLEKTLSTTPVDAGALPDGPYMMTITGANTGPFTARLVIMH